MERKSFLRFCWGVGTFLSAPLDSYANRHSKKRATKGFKVSAGKDRDDSPISLFEGDTFYTKVSTNDSDGDVFVFESTRMKVGGPSFHLHYDQDEFWYIISGEFQFKIGNETFTAKPGDTIFGPRQVPHAFTKIGEGEAKLLMFFQKILSVKKNVLKKFKSGK